MQVLLITEQIQNTGQNVTISGGTNYTKGESVTITANYNLFNAPPSLDDVVTQLF